MPVDIRQIEEVLDEDVRNSAFVKSLDQRYVRKIGGGDSSLSFVSDTAIAYSDTPGVVFEANPLQEQEYYVHLGLPSNLKNISELVDSLNNDLTYAFQKIETLKSQITSTATSLRSEMASLKSSDITLSGTGVDTSDSATAGINVTGQNGAYYLQLALPKSLTDNFGKTISFTRGNISYSDSAAQGTEVVTAGDGAYQVNVTLPNNVTVVSTGGGDSTVALAKGTVSTVSDYTNAGVTPRLDNGIYYLDLTIPVQSGGGGTTVTTSGGALALAKGNVDYGANVGVSPRRSGDTFYLDLTLPVTTSSGSGGNYVKDVVVNTFDPYASSNSFTVTKNSNNEYYIDLLLATAFTPNSTVPVYTSSLTADILCWKELSSDAELANVEDGLSLVKFPSGGINYYGYWMKKGNVGGGYFINDDSKLVAGHATRDGGWQKASQILDEHTYQDIIFGAPKDTQSGIILNTTGGYYSYATKVNNLEPGRTIALSGSYDNKKFTGGLLKIGPGAGIGVIEFNGHAIPVVSHGSHIEIPAPFETARLWSQGGSGSGTTNANLKLALNNLSNALVNLGNTVDQLRGAFNLIYDTYKTPGLQTYINRAVTYLNSATSYMSYYQTYLRQVT